MPLFWDSTFTCRTASMASWADQHQLDQLSGGAASQAASDGSKPLIRGKKHISHDSWSSNKQQEPQQPMPWLRLSFCDANKRCGPWSMLELAHPLIFFLYKRILCSGACMIKMSLEAPEYQGKPNMIKHVWFAYWPRIACGWIWGCFPGNLVLSNILRKCRINFVGWKL